MILRFLLVLSLIVNAVPVFAAPEISEAPINPEFEEWLKKQQEKKTTLNRPSSGGSPDINNASYPTGVIPVIKNLSHLKGEFGTGFKTNNSSKNGKASMGTKPKAINCNWQDKKCDDMVRYMPPIRNQGSEGNCWAYATFSSLETNLKKDKNEENDFYEHHMAANHGFDNGINDGGNYLMATAFLSRWGGPVAEGTSGPVLKHLQGMQIIPEPDKAYDGPDNGYDPVFINNIKKAIVAYGPVYISFDSQDGRKGCDNFYDTTKKYFYAYNCPSPSDDSCQKARHAVSIVGWDDTVLASNFGKSHSAPYMPPGPGAFIVRNSWGRYNAAGPNDEEAGYFFLSYYDTSMHNPAVFETAEDADNYDDIYQHDDFGSMGGRGYYSPIGWGANVFKAKKDTYLSAVSFWAEDVSEKYTVYVYTDLSAPSDPVSGTKHEFASGTLENAGYYTINASSLIPLKKDKNFAVVIKFDTSATGYEWPIPYEFKKNGKTSNFVVNPGESFFSPDGSTWTDGYNQNTKKNIPIKAFTFDDKTPPVWPPLERPVIEDIPGDGSYLRARWPSASDPDSGVSEYMIAIGTSEGSDDVLAWQGTGNSYTNYTYSKKLSSGTTYYFGVKAKNGSGFISEAIWSKGYWFAKPYPPSAVYDGNIDYDIDYTKVPDNLSAHWDPSPSADENHTAAASYWYAIGTSPVPGSGMFSISSFIPGNESGWVNNGTDTRISINLKDLELSLEQGKTYYVSVMARDSAGHYSEASVSNGQTLDTTVPVIEGIILETPHSFDSSDTEFSALGSSVVSTGAISGYFAINDEDSFLQGTPKFYISIDSREREQLAVSLKESSDGKSYWNFEGNIPESDAHKTAVFSFYARTRAGQESAGEIAEGSGFRSRFRIRRTAVQDHTPPYWPEGSAVRDGLGSEDISSINMASSLSANWDAAEDGETGIYYYEYSINAQPEPGEPYIVPWTNAGNQRSVTHEGLSLEYGKTYYFHVRAANMADHTPASEHISAVKSSNGQRIKSEPADVSAVYCAAEGEGTGYSNWTNTFAAHWTPGEESDPNVAATGFWYAIGTSIGGTEISSEFSTEFGGWIKTGDTSVNIGVPELSDEKDYYLTVKAYNDHGGESENVNYCKTHIMRTPAKMTGIKFSGENYNYDTVDEKHVVSFGGIQGRFTLDKVADAVQDVPSLSFEDSKGRQTALLVERGADDYSWNFSGAVEAVSSTGTATFIYSSLTKAGVSGNVIEAGGQSFEIRKSTVADHTPPFWPSEARVRDGLGDTDIGEADTDNELSANWDAAVDNDTAIDHYEYSIGTTAGDTNVLGWTATENRYATATGLSLTFGETYYFNVRAYDLLGNLTENALSSDGQRVKNEPGNIPAVYCSDAGEGTGYSNWTSSFAAHWDASAETYQARKATGYKYAIGTAALGTDISAGLPGNDGGWIDAGSGLSALVPENSLALADETDYYFSVKAYNALDGESEIAYCRTHIMRTPAKITGITFSGENYNYDTVDEKHVVSFAGIQGSLTLDKIADTVQDVPTLSFEDSKGRQTALLVERGTDEYSWNFSGTVEAVSSTGTATFIYSSLTKAGVSGNVIEAGRQFEIRKSTVPDHSAPFWPASAKVRDGLGDIDIGEAETATELSANWDAAEDSATNWTGIDYYEYSIGTDPGATDILDWKATTERSVTEKGLVLGFSKKYYFNVRAYDRLGNMTENALTSDGQQVDSSPGDIPAVYCSLEGRGNGYANWTNTFAAHWEQSSQEGLNPELVATGYLYALGSYNFMGDVIDWTPVPADQLSADLALGDTVLQEKEYYFSVKAVNAYAESKETKFCRITIDRTAPQIKSMSHENVQQAGTEMTGSFELSENASAIDTISLYFRMKGNESATLYPVSISSQSANGNKWNFSTFIGLDPSLDGEAEFVLSAVDKAGNVGSTILGGADFTINAKKDVSENDAVFETEDGYSVKIPSGTVDGSIKVSITEVSNEAESVINANEASPDTKEVSQKNMIHNFKAFDGDGNPVSQFPRGVNISFTYNDSDGDGLIDMDDVPVESLYVCYLDEAKGKWIPLLNTKRDKASRQISADVGHFSIFSVRIVSGVSKSFDARPSPTPCHYPAENVTFKGIPAGASEIRTYIYNTAGELVRELETDELVWDGKTRNGSKAATGMYIYLIKTASHGSSRGKLYIIW